MTARLKNSAILLAFFIILLFPFLGAWTLFFKGEPHSLSTSNHGELITPLRNITALKLQDLDQNTLIPASSLAQQWWLVYLGPEKCQQACHHTLYNMRQIRTALGKDSHRLGKLFIAHPHCPQSVCEQFISEQYPDLRKIRFNPQDFESLFLTVGNKNERTLVGELYILDPQGNFMMRYSIESPPKEILQDLKRLLKVSKVG